MKKAANDNTDTWTRISVAAERALAEIEESKEKMAREHQKTGHENDDHNQGAERAAHKTILVENRKRSA